MNQRVRRALLWVAPPALGLLHALSIALPGSGQPLAWLQWLSLAGLVLWVALRAEQSPWRAGAAAWLFAWAWIAGSTWWLFVSMHVYGGLHAVLAVLAVAALSGALALYYATAMAAWVALGGLERPALWRCAALFAAVWTLAELARGQWLTGFPWGAGGYAHVDGWLAGLAPWVGVYGIGAVSAWLAAWVALMALCGRAAWTRQQFVPALAALGVLVGLVLGAAGWTQPAGQLTLRLLQGNIPQDEKFQPGTGVPQALSWYGEQLRSNTASLVVAPETAMPLLLRQLPEGYWAAITQRYSSGEQAALLGMPMGSFSEGYTNSAIGLSPQQREVYRYDKHHLVPFGEFIPPLFRWFTDLMNIPLGDFSRGQLGQPAMGWQGQRIAPNICYEDLFGEEIGAGFAQANLSPTVLVNMSNIGWFGDTVAVAQHLNISRMRTLEFQRPMARATNTGSTAVIDHTGRITHSLAPYTRGVLDATVQGRTGLTPFARWVSRLGLWPLWLLCAALVALAWMARRRSGAR